MQLIQACFRYAERQVIYHFDLITFRGYILDHSFPQLSRLDRRFRKQDAAEDYINTTYVNRCGEKYYN